APAMHAGACIPCAPPRRLKATSVISRDRMHLLRCQLPRDRAHLLADVVLAHALSEGQQLAFDTVTGGAWRDAACGRLDGYTRVRQIPERAQEGRDAARPSAASWRIGSRIYWRPSSLNVCRTSSNPSSSYHWRLCRTGRRTCRRQQ